MATSSRERNAWTLVRAQDGVVSHAQLRALGYSDAAIKHRVRTGRLHVVYRGVYAVGRPELTRRGAWKAATLACDGALSHSSAGALWDIAVEDGLHVSTTTNREHAGITVHRRTAFEVVTHGCIPVTTPICTIVDLAPTIDRDALEAMISRADTLGLVHPDQLRAALDRLSRRPGIGVVRAIFDKWDFVCTDSRLERHFLPIAARAGLPPNPIVHIRLNGFRIDFYYPTLRLVIETDGLRYHRNAYQQGRRAKSLQAHVAAGLTPLFFTRYQVVHEPEYVEGILRPVVARLAA